MLNLKDLGAVARVLATATLDSLRFRSDPMIWIPHGDSE